MILINKSCYNFGVTESKFNFKLLLSVLGVATGVAGMYFAATRLVPNVLVTLTQAEPEKIVSMADSLVLGEKILARADGTDTNVVNVFVLNTDLQGVADKQVFLSSSGGLIDEAVKLTDKDGKASFEIRSEVEGQFEVSAAVEGAPLSRGVTVTFRN